MGKLIVSVNVPVQRMLLAPDGLQVPAIAAPLPANARVVNEMPNAARTPRVTGVTLRTRLLRDWAAPTRCFVLFISDP